LLAKVYRVGPERHAVVRGQVVHAANAKAVIESLSAVGEWQVRQAPRTLNGIWISKTPAWLHTLAARDHYFQGLADAQRTIAKRVQERGGLMLPSAIRNVSGHWKHYLCPDRHCVETADPIERAIYCNLLRQYSAAFIASFGRAGVSATGVDTGHCRLILEGAFFPSRPWISTETPFLDRIESYLRRFEGVPRLDSIEVSPRSGSSASATESVLADGPVTLAFVRAAVIIHQALFLRARRMARSGQTPSHLRQDVSERNRSRVAVDGPRARLEPGGSQAGHQTINLIQGLRPELQVLEVSWGELAPLVLGPTLRHLGYSALQNENDLVRLIAREAAQQRKDVVGWISERLYPGNMEDTVTSINSKRCPAISSEVGDWWTQWLRGAFENITPMRSKDSPSIRAKPSERIQRPHGVPDHRRRAPEARPAAPRSVRDVFSSLLSEERPSAEARRQAILRFAEQSRPDELHVQLRKLDSLGRQEIEKAVAPGAGGVRAATPSSAFWDDPVIKKSTEFAMRAGIGIVATEAPDDQEKEFAAWLDQFQRVCPTDLLLFPWRRVRYQGKIRQEFVILPRVWTK